MIQSIVIVKVTEGYLAHLRFSDSSLDEDLCAETRWAIFERINKKVRALDPSTYYGRSSTVTFA